MEAMSYVFVNPIPGAHCVAFGGASVDIAHHRLPCSAPNDECDETRKVTAELRPVRSRRQEATWSATPYCVSRLMVCSDKRHRLGCHH